MFFCQHLFGAAKRIRTPTLRFRRALPSPLDYGGKTVYLQSLCQTASYVFESIATTHCCNPASTALCCSYISSPNIPATVKKAKATITIKEFKTKFILSPIFINWWAPSDLNRESTNYEFAALTVMLEAQIGAGSRT